MRSANKNKVVHAKNFFWCVTRDCAFWSKSRGYISSGFSRMIEGKVRKLELRVSK